MLLNALLHPGHKELRNMVRSVNNVENNTLLITMAKHLCIWHNMAYDRTVDRSLQLDDMVNIITTMQTDRNLTWSNCVLRLENYISFICQIDLAQEGKVR